MGSIEMVYSDYKKTTFYLKSELVTRSNIVHLCVVEPHEKDASLSH